MHSDPAPIIQFNTNASAWTPPGASAEDVACAARITAALSAFTPTLTLPDLEQLLADGIAAARRRASDESAQALRIATETAAAHLGAGVTHAVTSLGAVSEKIQTDVGASVTTAVRAALDPSVFTGSVTEASRAVSDDVFRANGQVLEALSSLRADVTAARAAEVAAAEQRAVSSAKGMDFEEYLSELLGEFAVREGISVISTGRTEGALKGCLKGDFLFTTTSGDVLFVVEAKDNNSRASVPEIHRYLDETCRNRDTRIAVWAVNGETQNRGNAFTRLTDQRWVCSAAEQDKDVFFLVLHILLTLARANAASDTAARTGSIDTARACVQSAITSLDALRRMRAKLSDMDKSVAGMRELVAAMERDVTAPLQEALLALGTGNVEAAAS